VYGAVYLAEALGLGLFMVAAGLAATVLDAPGSPVREWIGDADLRRVLAGVAMGLTAVGLIYSPWGKLSGAHLNPAVTLGFLHLGRIRPGVAAGYIVAQFIGGTLGVLLVLGLAGDSFAMPPVYYAATLPGPRGVALAFVAEFAISFVLLFIILHVAAHPRHAPRAGVVAGVLVALYICVEAPLSGMSMNPARSFASAAPGALWEHLWVYFVAPPLGMVLAAEAHRRRRSRPLPCAKLVHDPLVSCIHCGHQP
jgi:aquaporin Z